MSANNKTVVRIFAITFDRNTIETWGFHHSTGDTVGHPCMSIPIGQYIDQSGEFPMETIKTRF